jgi:hypothetical protein
MANLKEKLRDLRLTVNSLLADEIGHAEEVEHYDAYDNAMGAVHAVEEKLKAVRAHVRAKMRKTLTAKQEACPHTSRMKTRTRYNCETKKETVEFEACTACSKSFDLRELVS